MTSGFQLPKRSKDRAKDQDEFLSLLDKEISNAELLKQWEKKVQSE